MTRPATVHFLTVSEVAETLRLSRMSVYRMCDDGTLPCIRVGHRGRTIRISAEAFNEYLAGLNGRRPEAPAVIPGQTEITA